MKVTERQAGWGFWLLWVVATPLGMFLGLIMGFIGAAPFYFVVESNLGVYLSGISWEIINGIGVGLMQWLVLRRYVSRTGWWILASIPGIYLGTRLVGNQIFNKPCVSLNSD